MKYFEVKFRITPYSSDAADIVAALAGEAGFETFEETAEGLTGYVQQQLLDEPMLEALLESCPVEGVTIDYDVTEAEDRDWNAQWEEQGFEPICVSDVLVIHDGRHLPRTSPQTVSIEIDAHQAFGTGTHETTRMVCQSLLRLPLSGKRMLDCGTGTGILAIAALKLGAREAVGYDIDEWAADNARHNAVINGVDEHFTVMLGDAHILNKVEGRFDVITANINRNILLTDLPAFVAKMAAGGTLVLSGFYAADVAIIASRASEFGLRLTAQEEDNDWTCLALRASEE